jgi:predicted peptidase
MAGAVRAQSAGSQRPGEFEGEITIKVKVCYLLFRPAQYDTKDSWPLLVFLHGAGERGDDLERVKVHGPPKIVETRKDFPFVVVSPQCPRRAWWQPQALAGLIDRVIAENKIDPDRVYLTGLSMGGYGTWSLAMAYPGKFAAIAPICGGGDPEGAAKIKHLPVWVFHGGKDRVVPLKQSQAMVDALKAAGADPRFTIYPEAGHDSWTEAYNDPKLYEWFLKQKRPKKS